MHLCYDNLCISSALFLIINLKNNKIQGKLYFKNTGNLNDFAKIFIIHLIPDYLKMP